MASFREDEYLLTYLRGDKKSALVQLEAYIKGETSFGGEISIDGGRALLLLSEIALFHGDVLEALGLLNQAREVLDSKEKSEGLSVRISTSRGAVLKLQGFEKESLEVYQQILPSLITSDRDSFFSILKLFRFIPQCTTHEHAYLWYESLKHFPREIALFSPHETLMIATTLVQTLCGFEACDLFEILIEKLHESDPLHFQASQQLKSLEQIQAHSEEIEDLFSQNQIAAVEKALQLIPISCFDGDKIRLYALVGDYYLSIDNLSQAFVTFNEAEELILKSKRLREPESVGFIFHNLSLLYGEQGNFHAALSRMEHALEIRKKYFDADHPAIAESTNALNVISEKLTGSPSINKKTSTSPLKEKISTALDLIKSEKLKDAEAILSELLIELE